MKKSKIFRLVDYIPDRAVFLFKDNNIKYYLLDDSEIIRVKDKKPQKKFTDSVLKTYEMTREHLDEVKRYVDEKLAIKNKNKC
jgi:hypothetical protein